MNRTISEHQVGCAGSGGGGGVSTTQQQTTTQSSPDSASSIGPFQSSILNRSNISLNDSGVGISPLTPRTNVFTFDSVEIDRHIRESIRESISSVESEQKDNKDVDGDAESDEEDAELARIVDSFASISSSSESSRLRPSAPINCEEDEADEEVPDYDDEENDDVFLSDDFEPSVSENKEEQARINNYLLTRTSRVEQRLSLQYGRRTNVVRNRLGGLQLSCQRFMHRIFGIGMPTPADSLGVATSSSSSFAIERDLIERMTISPANNELNFRVQESFNVNASTSSTNQTDQNRHEDDHAVQSQRNNSLPDVVPDSAVMAREIMRNMARKQRVSQRNICHRSASFAAPTSASVESARVASMENRRTMSVSFPIEQTSLTLVARQLREISIDFSAQQNQMRSAFGSSLYPVFDLLANTFIETTRCVSRVTRRRTFAAPSTRSNPSTPSNAPTRPQHLRQSPSIPIRRTATPSTPQASSIRDQTTSYGRVVNNSRFYTNVSQSAPQHHDTFGNSSSISRKYNEENNNNHF